MYILHYTKMWKRNPLETQTLNTQVNWVDSRDLLDDATFLTFPDSRLRDTATTDGKFKAYTPKGPIKVDRQNSIYTLTLHNTFYAENITL